MRSDDHLDGRLSGLRRCQIEFPKDFSYKKRPFIKPFTLIGRACTSVKCGLRQQSECGEEVKRAGGSIILILYYWQQFAAGLNTQTGKEYYWDVSSFFTAIVCFENTVQRCLAVGCVNNQRSRQSASRINSYELSRQFWCVYVANGAI